MVQQLPYRRFESIYLINTPINNIIIAAIIKVLTYISQVVDIMYFV